jgi:hypothetical protein
MCKSEQLFRSLLGILFGVVARERGHGLVAKHRNTRRSDPHGRFASLFWGMNSLGRTQGLGLFCAQNIKHKRMKHAARLMYAVFTESARCTKPVRKQRGKDEWEKRGSQS